MRTNLDPFDSHNTADLLHVLEQVGLDRELLEVDVGVDAGFLSAGQRQLVTLARVLLRKVHIVVMDEPTSRMDIATDDKVQRAMRRCFAHATVLVIAHRLSTIMDLDRIVVMGQGRVLENGAPEELAQVKDGHLKGMLETASFVHTSGKEAALRKRK